MDYSDCDFTFLASSAPPYPTDVSEPSDMDLAYSDSDSISTPSGPVSKLASPIFTFNSSSPSEAKALFDTITHRDMSQDIYLIDVSSALHSSAAVTIEAKVSSGTCLPHQTVPQSIYIIDPPPSAPDNRAVVATTPSGANAPPIISFSRRAMSGPAQVADITSPVIDFYNSATTTTALAGGAMFGPAQSAEFLTSPIVASYKPTAVTNTPEIETPYTTFSLPAESRPTQPVFTSYNYTPVTTNAIHNPNQSAEFIAFPTFAPYNPVTITTPLTYRTISGPPQVEEIIASPVFTFYNPTAVRATEANFQALLTAPFTISSSPQIITLDQVCDAEDETMEYDNDQVCETEAKTMECDNKSGKEGNKGGKDGIMKRNYTDRIIEGEDKIVVGDIRKEEEDKMIEDEDRNIEKVDRGGDSEEEIDQGEESEGSEEESYSEGESEEEINKGEEESEGSEEESEDSEDESEDEINKGEVESEESEKESEDSEDENEEEEEESEEEIEESEEESEEREEDNNIKGENRYNKFEVEEAVVGERNSKVENSGAEDLAIDNRKDGDGEIKDSNFEYSGTEEGSWSAKWDYKSRGEVGESEEGPSKTGEAEPMTEGKAGEGNKSEDGSGRESFRGKKEIAEDEGKGDNSVEVEAVQEYQVEVEDEEVEKSEIATVAQLVTRKIAPLRRRFPNVLAVSTPATLFLSPPALFASTPVRGGEEELEQEWKDLDRSGDSDESLSDPESDSGDEALGWAGKVAVAESKLEKAVGAFELSEIAVEVPFNDPVVSVPASTPTYTSAPSDGGSSYESLSEPENDEGDEALGWTLPESEEDHGEEKEEITPTPTLISSPVRNTTITATIWKPSSIFIPNRAFAPASVAIRPRPPPVIITGRWVREHRGSRKEWTWVVEDSTAVPQRDIGIAEDEEEVEEIMAVKTEEEEDAIRAEIFRADMARVRGRGWSWEREVLVEGIVTTTAATVPEFAHVGTGDAPSVEDESPSNSPTDPGLITMPTGRWTFPVWSLLLVFVAITLLAWISRVRQSLTGNVLWDGIVPGTLAWEPIAPLETALLKIGWQLLPVNSGTTALALFLSVVFADIYAVARGRVAMGSSSSLFGWIVGVVSGAAAVTRGVMRWRGALAMTTTEGRVVFTLPEAVTGAVWEGVKEVSGYEEHLPIEFVSAGDIAPAVDMCPRHELGIGAGTGGLRDGTGSLFGLGLFLLGFLVWGSGRRQLRRSAGGV